jgi:quercetin dioxygenase-like cupin family protein
MPEQNVNKQPAAGTPPAGIKAGNGRYYFDLATVNRIEAGPAYSTAAGSLVEGERIQCGLMHMPKGTGSRPHSHPNEQWVYVVQGTLESEIEGVKALSPPGTLIYIPANAIHTAVAVPDQGEVVFFTCKDMSHGIWGNPIDTSAYGPRYAPGFEKK